MSVAVLRARVNTQVLRYLHAPHLDSQGVAHLDLSPENVMYDAEWNMKLIDFGGAAKFTPGSAAPSPLVSKFMYRAPELQSGAGPYYPDKIDVWGAATIVLFCLTGLSYRFSIPGVRGWNRLRLSAGLNEMRRVVGAPTPTTPPCAGCMGVSLHETRGSHVRTVWEFLNAACIEQVSTDADGGVHMKAARFLCWLMHEAPDARPTAAEALTHPWLDVAGGGGGGGGEGDGDVEMT